MYCLINKMLLPRIIQLHLLLAHGTASLTAISLPKMNPSITAPDNATPTPARPNCGRNRPTMPYHTSEYYDTYKDTPYGWLGCNHEATASEAFHAFALKLQDEPERLEWYSRLAQRVVDHTVTRLVGMGFQELVMGLTGKAGDSVMMEVTRGEPEGTYAWGGDRLGAAVVFFFQPPSVRCWLDWGILREMGVVGWVVASPDGGSLCGSVGDQELLTKRGAERMILRVVGEFKEALRRTLLAIETGDEVYLFG